MFRACLALLRAFALVCALVIFLATPRVCASQSNDQGLAPSVAAALTKAKVKRVVIFDFIGPGYVNQLGRDLAEGLSESLAKEHKKFHIVDRPALSAAFEKNLVRPELVREPEVAWWLASQLRADPLTAGKFLPLGKNVR